MCSRDTSRDVGTRTAMAAENKNADPDSARVWDRDSLANDSFQDSFQTRVFKIIVIGDSNVGKTCLTYRFCEAKFLKNPEATIGVDFREKTLELDGENIKVRKWIIACVIVIMNTLDTVILRLLFITTSLHGVITVPDSRGVLYRMMYQLLWSSTV